MLLNHRFAFVGLGLAVVVSSLAIAGEVIQLEAGVKQLFLDDYVIAEMEGLERTMHRPEKRGPLLRPDIPSDGDLIQIRSAPMWVPDEAEYKLLYLAYARDGRNVVGVALATSKDGLRWEKPVLGEVVVFGSTENNWIAKEPELVWPQNSIEGVVYDPDDADPNRRYKALLGASGRQPIVSPDCIHWTRLDVPKIPSSDECELTYDRPRRRFLAMVKGSNEYGRAFNLSVSENFEEWTAPRALFGADAVDQEMAPEVIRRRLADPGVQNPVFVAPDPDSGWVAPEGETHQPTWRAEVYNVAVFPYEGVYIGLPTMYYPTGTALPARNNTDGFDVIQLAMSRDLEKWVRLGDRQPFIEASRIDKGRVGVYDRGQFFAASNPIDHDDELWFYYSALKWRSEIYKVNADGSDRDPATLTTEEQADLEDGWGGVCLAVLRKDGFVSLDAGERGGYLVTKPLRLEGEGLFVNLEATDGTAKVEVVDEDGGPVAGYAGDDAVALSGDGVRKRVRWRSESSLKGLAGKAVRLKIHLRHARIFAFWTE